MKKRAAAPANDGEAGENDTLASVEEATLTGGAGANVLNASAFTLGPVILDGAGGADSLLGGSAGDT